MLEEDDGSNPYDPYNMDIPDPVIVDWINTLDAMSTDVILKKLDASGIGPLAPVKHIVSVQDPHHVPYRRYIEDYLSKRAALEAMNEDERKQSAINLSKQAMALSARANEIAMASFIVAIVAIVASFVLAFWKS